MATNRSLRSSSGTPPVGCPALTKRASRSRSHSSSVTCTSAASASGPPSQSTQPQLTTNSEVLLSSASRARLSGVCDLVLGEVPALGDDRVAAVRDHHARAARAGVDGVSGADEDVVGFLVCSRVLICGDENLLAAAAGALTLGREELCGLGLGHALNVLVQLLP